MERAQSNCHDLRNLTYVNKPSKSQDAEMDYSDQRGPVLVLLLQTFHNFDSSSFWSTQHVGEAQEHRRRDRYFVPLSVAKDIIDAQHLLTEASREGFDWNRLSYLSSNFHKISRNSYNWAYYDWHWLDFSWLAVICETLTGPRRWVSATKRACLQKQVCSRVVAQSTGRVRHRLATRYAMVYMMSHDESWWVMMIMSQNSRAWTAYMYSSILLVLYVLYDLHRSTMARQNFKSSEIVLMPCSLHKIGNDLNMTWPI